MYMPAFLLYIGRKVAVTLKTREGDDGYVSYRAKVEVFIEPAVKMDGRTRGGREQVIRRAMRAEKPLPRHVEEIAVSVLKHILSWLDAYKIERASACMRVDVDRYADVKVCADVYYWIQGIAKFTAIFHGHDGSTTGWHRVAKIVVMLDGELRDHVDRLTREMLNVVKHAYNIYVEKGSTQRLEPEQRQGGA